MPHHLFDCIEFLPIVIDRGKGSYVWDTLNKKYLDLNAGQFCSILGHTPKSLSTVVAKQMRVITHTSTRAVSPMVLEAAQTIHDICPEIHPSTIFLSTGAEAVECAIRYAKHVTHKHQMICFDNGYHGLSLGSQSVTYGGIWAMPNVNGIFAITAPVFHELSLEKAKIETEKSLKKLDEILTKHAHSIAALIMEPIISVGGMNFLSKRYCQGIARLCKRYDVLLIYDECQTGIGRTGSWFAYQQLGVKPDMVIAAKALGAGFPVSMVAFNQELLKQATITINHFSSHQNDPIAAAIVVAVIDQIRQDQLLDRITTMGSYFLQQLKLLSQRTTLIRYPRGKGLMLSFDLYVQGLTSYLELGETFSTALLEAGVLIQSTSHGKTYRILPNYYLSKKEIDTAIAVIENVAHQCLKKDWTDAITRS